MTEESPVHNPIATYFAPAERAEENSLQKEIQFVSHNPVMDGLLKTTAGLLAILNEQRQILAINDTFLQILGIKDPEQVFGLRPGEFIQCIHAHDMPGGCGTSQHCTTCGAAISIVSALAGEKSKDMKCIATIEQNGKKIDRFFLVKSSIVLFDGHRFVLLFMQDITVPQRWASIERLFFHDVNNLLMCLHGTSKLMESANEDRLRKCARQIITLSQRLTNEVAMQNALSQNELKTYPLALQDLTTDIIMNEIRNLYGNHPAVKDKSLHIAEAIPKIHLKTDFSLLIRLLTNMLTNALEATEESGTVKMWAEYTGSNIIFCVWNQQTIPENIALRIFQRNFSTKQESGRGLGTYSMKFFGEQILGGQVSFTSKNDEGTIFRLSLPV